MDPRRPRWRNPFEPGLGKNPRGEGRPGSGRYMHFKEPTLLLGPRRDEFRTILKRIEEECCKMRPSTLQKACQEIWQI